MRNWEQKVCAFVDVNQMCVYGIIISIYICMVDLKITSKLYFALMQSLELPVLYTETLSLHRGVEFSSTTNWLNDLKASLKVHHSAFLLLDQVNNWMFEQRGFVFFQCWWHFIGRSGSFTYSTRLQPWVFVSQCCCCSCCSVFLGELCNLSNGRPTP